jgi:4-aminobutyrate aminotransferase-like enzyme
VVNACRPDTLRLAPPFIVSDSEIDEAVEILAAVLA